MADEVSTEEVSPKKLSKFQKSRRKRQKREAIAADVGVDVERVSVVVDDSGGLLSCTIAETADATVDLLQKIHIRRLASMSVGVCELLWGATTVRKMNKLSQELRFTDELTINQLQEPKDGSASPIEEVVDSRMSYCSHYSTDSFGESRSSQSMRSHSSRQGANVYATSMASPPCLALGVETRDTVLMVINIVNFHSLAELVTSNHIMDMYSVWMETVVNLAKRFRGAVDRFQTDKLLLSWPCRQWANALECGLGLARAMETQNKVWQPESLPELEVNIGISVGRVLLGNMGCPSMRSHTIIGTAVQLALQLQRLNKIVGTQILADRRLHVQSQFHFNSRPITSYSAPCTRHGTSIGVAYEVMGKKEDNEEEWMYNLPDSGGEMHSPYFRSWTALERNNPSLACQYLQTHLENVPEDYAAQQLHHRICRIQQPKDNGNVSPSVPTMSKPQLHIPTSSSSTENRVFPRRISSANICSTPRTSATPAVLCTCATSSSTKEIIRVDSTLGQLAKETQRGFV
eukprot:TRINITY_DN29725_c0_g1_i1.p1 TRINITY_DN29725_c0_g1~~TRINITY_DN29725_c0_g1_i1.p1  ORF type:complete len:518 (-),score=34.95 TRINITY_DN29725_c0_g1_i1:70-1623(-)